MIPYIEVSHLPSSSSFFSAVLQPLGLRCISPDAAHRDSSELQSSVAYGPDSNNIILQVRQSEHPLKPPRLSSVVLSAAAKSAVSHFYSCWLKTDPPTWSLFRDERGLELLYDDREQALKGPFRTNTGGTGAVRAIVYDHDGNRFEVICHDSPQHRSSTPRVLDWKHTFDLQGRKQSHIGPSSRILVKPNMAPSQSQDRSSHVLSTSSSSTAARTRDVEPQETEQKASPRESSITDGLNTTTVVGALLGVAAGAALTYGFVSNNSSPSRETPHRQEQEHQRGPPLSRRATFPEKPVTGHRNPPRYDDVKKRMNEYSVPRRFADPGFQSFGLRGGYADADGDDDVDYGVTPAPPTPRFLTQGPSPSSDVRSRVSSRTRPVDNLDDGRSRHTTRSTGRPPSTRARSETPRDRVPLAPGHDCERRSHAPSRRSAATESVVSRPPLSRTHRSNIEPDRETYVSAGSRRSRSTARPPSRDSRGSEYETTSRRHAPSQVSAATMRETPREMPGRASSHVSARRVPLPRSVVGSSHAHWDPWDVPLPMSGVGSSHANWDDDMVSLAPSDSISCAGSKHRSRKSRH